MVKPVLFCAFLLVTCVALTFIRPTNDVELLLHPASFQNHFSGHVSMLFSPLVLRLLGLQGQSPLQPNILLPFFILMLCFPLLPIDSPGLLQDHFLHIFWANISHVNFLSPSNIKVCHYGHLLPRSRVSHITAPAGPLTCLHI